MSEEAKQAGAIAGEQAAEKLASQTQEKADAEIEAAKNELSVNAEQGSIYGQNINHPEQEAEQAQEVGQEATTNDIYGQNINDQIQENENEQEL